MTDSAQERRGEEFLGGNGEMTTRMRATDWWRPPLGPVSDWPYSLKIVLRILLTSKYAMWLGWGRELAFFCNDAYRYVTPAAWSGGSCKGAGPRSARRGRSPRRWPRWSPSGRTCS